jgi:ribosomal protein S18 acetylase RimI-like enzyme
MARHLLAEAGAWLLGRGIRQWAEPPSREALSAAAGRGELYLALRAGTAVGTFQLTTDSPAWPQAGDSHDAAYVSSIARRPGASDKGLGLALLEAAAGIALASGKRRFRLDCWAGNHRLRRLYREAGFAEVAVVPENDYLICLMEKMLPQPPASS